MVTQFLFPMMSVKILLRRPSLEFPTGLQPKYYPGLMQFNSSAQMGTGVSSMAAGMEGTSC